jgi:phage shock protein E
MIQFLKKLLGIGPSVNFKDLVAGGAQIIDVRTKSEYQSGHIKGSVNIPLQSLSGSLSKIKKDKPRYHVLCFRDEKCISSKYFEVQWICRSI